MAISPFKTFSAGEVLTASDLNSSFTQITNNGEDLGWPITTSKDFNGFELILDADGDTSIHASTDDQIDFKLAGSDAVVFTTSGVEVRSTDAGAAAGPTIKLIRDSASPADADFIGRIDFLGDDSGATETTYGRIGFQLDDVTDGTEDAAFLVEALVNGVMTTIFEANAAGAALSGGTIDNTVIGGVTPAAGSFTTLSTTGEFTSGNNIVPASDSQDSLGSTSFRYLKAWVDSLTAGTMTIGAGSISDSSGAISFADENLSTTGTLAAGTTTIGTMVVAAGSITDTSGSISFGNENLTTTGVITGLTVEATGDTAAGDNSAMGYTATEGLVLTGQGSTYDMVLKNDADAIVMQVPTGTRQGYFPGGIASTTTTTGTLLVTGGVGITGEVHIGGDMQANIGSDLKWKKNVAVIDDIWTKFEMLHGVGYDYINPTSPSKADRQYGFIAQDYQRVFPENVNDLDGGLRIKQATMAMEALLTEGVKDLHARLSKLEAA